MSSVEYLRNLIIKVAVDKEVNLRFSLEFDKAIKKIKDKSTKTRLFKQILKVIQDPSVGKYLRFSRKSEQEVYLPPFRIYYKEERILRFVEFSHKDEQ